MLHTVTRISRRAVLPAVVALALVGAVQPAPAKAAGLVEVVVIGAGMVVGAAAVAALTAGMGPAMMMGPMAMEGAGMGAGMAAAEGAGAGAGMMAAEGGFMGHMTHMGSQIVAHATFNPYRTGAVALGALAGGWLFGLPFGS